MFTIVHVDASLSATAAYAIALQGISVNCPTAAPLPGPPTNSSGSSNGNAVQLLWGAPIVGAAPMSYLLEAGRAAGTSDIATVDTGSTSITFGVTGVPNGVYFLRVRARHTAGASTPSNEVRLAVGPEPCSSPPEPPSGLASVVNRSAANLRWTTGAGIVTSYRVEARSSSGAPNLVILDTRSTRPSLETTPPGSVNFVRVRNLNECGHSVPSDELRVVVGPEPCSAPPAAPTGLTASVAGLNVTLSWTAASGNPVSSVLEAGATAGAADIARVDLGELRTSFEAVAPSGTCLVRVRARNACGLGGASNEVTVVR